MKSFIALILCLSISLPAFAISSSEAQQKKVVLQALRTMLVSGKQVKQNDSFVYVISKGVALGAALTYLGVGSYRLLDAVVTRIEDFTEPRLTALWEAFEKDPTLFPKTARRIELLKSRYGQEVDDLLSVNRAGPNADLLLRKINRELIRESGTFKAKAEALFQDVVYRPIRFSRNQAKPAYDEYRRFNVENPRIATAAVVVAILAGAYAVGHSEREVALTADEMKELLQELDRLESEIENVVS